MHKYVINIYNKIGNKLNLGLGNHIIYLTTDVIPISSNSPRSTGDYGGGSVFWGGSMEVRVVRLLVKPKPIDNKPSH